MTVLLVTTATRHEAQPLIGGASPTDEVHGTALYEPHSLGVPALLAVTGLGRANTAFHLGRLLLALEPAAVVQVGIGGSFDLDVAPIGQVVLATSDTYADLGVQAEDGWLPASELGLPLAHVAGRPVHDTFTCHAAATAAGAASLAAPTGPFVTVETVTGTTAHADELRARHRPLVESMEGAAGAHACALTATPYVELRTISNPVGARDRTAWRLGEAIGAIAPALERALPVIAEALR